MGAWLLPVSAQGHGTVYQAAASTTPDGYVGPASLADIEDAIAEASAEFGVPEPLLQVIAHVESRWEHRPYRLSHNGRRGLFRLNPNRLSLAASLLGEDPEDVATDIHLHARGFAALLDASRPLGASSQLGTWRDALEWVFELPEAAADQVIDLWMATLDEGVLHRLDTGEPIAIAPSPIDPAYLGLFAAARGSACRSSDYPGAAENLAPSCNYSSANRTSGDVQYVIVHTAEGSYNGTISWFNNCSAQVSAHYVVSESGQITQMVREDDIGWHVSCWNGETIGIEHEGYASNSTHEDAMYQASANLTADILADWNLPADRSVVMGHVEIDPGCNPNSHWDPGPGWDWDYYMDLIGGENTVDLTELVGYIRHTDLYEPSYGIPSATVTVDGMSPVTADNSGYYVVDTIAPGTYTICASAAGYEEGCTTKTIQADLTNWGSILLEPASGDDDDTPDDAGDDDTGDDDTPDDTGDDDTGDDDSPDDSDDDDSDSGADSDPGGSVDDDDDDVADGEVGEPEDSDVATIGSNSGRRDVLRPMGCQCQAQLAASPQHPLERLLMLLGLLLLGARRRCGAQP